MSHYCMSNPCPLCYPKYAEISLYMKPPYWFTPYTLSDEDVDKIAKRVVELMNGNLRSD